MIACLDGWTAGCAPLPRGTKRFLDEDEFADDDEHALVEGWLRKRNERKALHWLWHTRFFRLEDGPGLLSYYVSSIWQGCRRAGYWELAHLVQVRTTGGEGLDSSLVLEFSEGPTRCVELRPAGGIEELQEWALQLQQYAGRSVVQQRSEEGTIAGEVFGKLSDDDR
mmetsp:Transcript_23505/g.54802  ORF Transcript_23505/g.54802 Transcript_23505/m.54802 type:complete len:167 (+) Transcript_23505:75-575(+)